MSAINSTATAAAPILPANSRILQTLTPAQIARKEAFLKQFSEFTLPPKNAVPNDTRPTLRFSLWDLLQFLYEKFEKCELVSEAPYLFGGAAAHIVAGLPYSDIDIGFTIKHTDYEFIRATLHEFLIIQLKKIGHSDLSSAFVHNTYFTVQKLVGYDFAIYTFGNLDLKFLHAQNRRQSLGDCDGFQVPLWNAKEGKAVRSIACINNTKWCSPAEFLEAAHNLALRKMTISDPDTCLDLMLRTSQKKSLGFEITNENRIATIAFDRLIQQFPLNAHKALFQNKFVTHQQSHFRKYCLSPVIDVLNFMRLILLGSRAENKRLAALPYLKAIAELYPHPHALHSWMRLLDKEPEKAPELLAIIHGIFFSIPSTDIKSYQSAFAEGLQRKHIAFKCTAVDRATSESFYLSLEGSPLQTAQDFLLAWQHLEEHYQPADLKTWFQKIPVDLCMQNFELTSEHRLKMTRHLFNKLVIQREFDSKHSTSTSKPFCKFLISHNLPGVKPNEALRASLQNDLSIIMKQVEVQKLSSSKLFELLVLLSKELQNASERLSEESIIALTECLQSITQNNESLETVPALAKVVANIFEHFLREYKTLQFDQYQDMLLALAKSGFLKFTRFSTLLQKWTLQAVEKASLVRHFNNLEDFINSLPKHYEVYSILHNELINALFRQIETHKKDTDRIANYLLILPISNMDPAQKQRGTAYIEYTALIKWMASILVAPKSAAISHDRFVKLGHLAINLPFKDKPAEHNEFLLNICSHTHAKQIKLFIDFLFTFDRAIAVKLQNHPQIKSQLPSKPRVVVHDDADVKQERAEEISVEPVLAPVSKEQTTSESKKIRSLMKSFLVTDLFTEAKLPRAEQAQPLLAVFMTVAKFCNELSSSNQDCTQYQKKLLATWENHGSKIPQSDVLQQLHAYLVSTIRNNHLFYPIAKTLLDYPKTANADLICSVLNVFAKNKSLFKKGFDVDLIILLNRIIEGPLTDYIDDRLVSGKGSMEAIPEKIRNQILDIVERLQNTDTQETRKLAHSLQDCYYRDPVADRHKFHSVDVTTIPISNPLLYPMVNWLQFINLKNDRELTLFLNSLLFSADFYIMHTMKNPSDQRSLQHVFMLSIQLMNLPLNHNQKKECLTLAFELVHRMMTYPLIFASTDYHKAPRDSWNDLALTKYNELRLKMPFLDYKLKAHTLLSYVQNIEELKQLQSTFTYICMQQETGRLLCLLSLAPPFQEIIKTNSPLLTDCVQSMVQIMAHHPKESHRMTVLPLSRTFENTSPKISAIWKKCCLANSVIRPSLNSPYRFRPILFAIAGVLVWFIGDLFKKKTSENLTV